MAHNNDPINDGSNMLLDDEDVAALLAEAAQFPAMAVPQVPRVPPPPTPKPPKLKN
jgi:hypothetical protein